MLRLENSKFTAVGWENGGTSLVSAALTSKVVADQWYQVMTSWGPTNGLRLIVDGVVVATTPQPN